jgi:hypothetical protein
MMLGLKQRPEHAGTPARGQPKQLLALSWSTLAFTAGSRAESSILDDDPEGPKFRVQALAVPEDVCS